MSDLGDTPDAPLAIPSELALLPLLNMVIYPQTVVPLGVVQEQSIRMIDAALAAHQPIGIVTLRHTNARPVSIGINDFYPIGTIALAHRLLRLPDNTLRIAVESLERIYIDSIIQTEPYLLVRVHGLPDIPASQPHEALHTQVAELALRMLDGMPTANDDLRSQIAGADDPRHLAHLVAMNLLFRSTIAERQQILEELDSYARLDQIARILQRELALFEQAGSIAPSASPRYTDQPVDRDPRFSREIDQFYALIDTCGMDETARSRAIPALEQLADPSLPPAERAFIRRYVEFLAGMPWQARSSREVDSAASATTLATILFDLEQPRDQVVEYLAAWELRRRRATGIQPALCLSGPPGVGKTALARALATALGRPFYTIAINEIHDADALLGRSMVGPGAIIQAIRRTQSGAPLILLDSIDTAGANVAAALCEALDPHQIHSFQDHYLGVPWDLGPAIILASAYDSDAIAPELQELFEIIHLPGYSVAQKQALARNYLLPVHLRAHALGPQDLQWADQVFDTILAEYTSEAGVRQFEQAIITICRKAAAEIARRMDHPAPALMIDTAQIRIFLGQPPFFKHLPKPANRPGVVPYLAWTPHGGEALAVEAELRPGAGEILIAGPPGSPLYQTAWAALALVRAEAEKLGIDPHFFEKQNIYISGITGFGDMEAAETAITVAIISLLSGKPVRSQIALACGSGQHGSITPVRAVLERALAAQRSGFHSIVLSRHNQPDTATFPPDLWANLECRFVDQIDDLLEIVL